MKKGAESSLLHKKDWDNSIFLIFCFYTGLSLILSNSVYGTELRPVPLNILRITNHRFVQKEVMLICSHTSNIIGS